MILDARIYEVRFTRERVVFELVDGRVVEVPFDWFPILKAAHPTARDEYEIDDEGIACEWPMLGERVTAECLFLVRYPGDGKGMPEKAKDAEAVPMPGNSDWGGLAERAQESTHTGSRG